MTYPALAPILAENYLRDEATALHRSEYHAGRVVPLHRSFDSTGNIIPMAGAQPPHNVLVVNLIRLLSNCYDATDHLVYASDQLIYAPGSESYYYADVSVGADQAAYATSAGGLDALLNPLLVVEVLSPSTAQFDRTDKFAGYRSIESLQQYVLVSSDEMLVETYVKNHPRDWTFRYENDPNKTIQIGAATPTLREIYRKVIFRTT